MPDKEKVIAKLKKAAKQCDTVYLSPDPDREGEAIAWHISQILPPDTNIKRVSFNSITKDAVLKALSQSERDRPGAGQCTAGAPPAGPDRRIQDFPHPQSPDPERQRGHCFRRAGAVRGFETCRRPRKRDRSI